VTARGGPSGTATAHSGLGAIDIVVLLAMQLAWGGSFVISKVAVNEMPPLLFMGARFLIVSIVLLPFLRWHRGQMLNVALISLFTGSLNFGFMIMGLAMADDVAPVAIAVQLGVPFATLLSVVVLHERLGIWRITALAIAFAGVLVVGFDPTVFQYRGALLLVVFAAFMMAVGTIFMRRVRGVPVYCMQAWIAVFAWPPLMIASTFLEGSPIANIFDVEFGWGAIAGLAWVIIGTSLIGHAAYYWIMQRHEVGLTAPFMLLAPILGAAGGAYFLGDVITWRMVVGGAMTLGGVLIITLREGRRRPQPELAESGL
jgi:O-acetylserine/cysteine efflux transporter